MGLHFVSTETIQPTQTKLIADFEPGVSSMPLEEISCNGVMGKIDEMVIKKGGTILRHVVGVKVDMVNHSPRKITDIFTYAGLQLSHVCDYMHLVLQTLDIPWLYMIRYSAHSTTFTTIKHRSDLHSWTTPHTTPMLWGVFRELYIQKWSQNIENTCHTVFIPVRQELLPANVICFERVIDVK